MTRNRVTLEHLKKKPSTPAKPPTPSPCPETKPVGEVPAELNRLDGKTPKEILLPVNPEMKIEPAAAMLVGLSEWLAQPTVPWPVYLPQHFQAGGMLREQG
jgi:hypothetical protein